MSNRHKNSPAETYLILKYGDMQGAFLAWMDLPYDTFTADEHEAIIAYNKVQFPNLNLIRTDSTRKD